jgi:hypothetical protein
MVATGQASTRMIGSRGPFDGDACAIAVTGSRTWAPVLSKSPVVGGHCVVRELTGDRRLQPSTVVGKAVVVALQHFDLVFP